MCVHYGKSPEVIRPPGKCYFFLWGMATVGQREGAQFLDWLIEEMAEVGTRSSLTSNHEIIN